MFGRNFILILLTAIAIYSIFLIFSDINLVYNKLSNFDWKFIPLILAIIFCSWLVLFARWVIILRSYKIHIPLKDNLLIYLAGFTLSITPIKTGELIKSVLLKNKFKIKRTISVPLVLVERFYDIIGTVILALVVILLMLFSIYSKSSFSYFLRFINKFKFLQKFSVSLEDSQDIIRNSLKRKTVFFSSVLTVLFRLVEALGIYIVLVSFGINIINYLMLATTYSVSIILGSVSMMPGGLGITEGSLAGLMSVQGMDLSTALILAIVIRFFTLWYGIVVGFIALKLSKGLIVNTE